VDDINDIYWNLVGGVVANIKHTWSSLYVRGSFRASLPLIVGDITLSKLERYAVETPLYALRQFTNTTGNENFCVIVFCVFCF
jgi:hypothetical protein